MPARIIGNTTPTGYAVPVERTPIVVGLPFFVKGGVDGWTTLRIWWHPISPGGGEPALDFTGVYVYLYGFDPTATVAVEPWDDIVADEWNSIDVSVPLNEWPSGRYYGAAVGLPHGGYPKKENVHGSQIVSGDNPDLVAASNTEALAVCGGAGFFYDGAPANWASPGALSFTSYLSSDYLIDIEVLAPDETGDEPPGNTAAPSVSGTPAHPGTTLASTTGTWTGAPTSYAYQWLRDGVPITDADESTYVLVEADIGSLIRCRVTATNVNGATAANSNGVQVTSGIPEPPPVTVQLYVKDEDEGELVPVDASGRPPAVRTFYPESFGALRNGRQITGVSMTSGSPVLSCPGAEFTELDAGKLILVNGPGLDANGTSLTGSILSVDDEDTVTLTVNAAQSCSSERAVFGTDDTQAIRDTVAAAVEFAKDSRTFVARVQFTAGIYMLGGTVPQDEVNYTYALIGLPYIDPAEEQHVVIELLGIADGSSHYHWQQPMGYFGGVVLCSTVMGATTDGTFQTPSVIGGPSYLPNFYDGSEFSNVLVLWDGIMVMQPKNPCLIAVDFYRCGQAHVKSGAALVDGTFEELNPFRPDNSQGCGLRMPALSNHNNCLVDTFHVSGHYYGYAFADHFTAIRIACFYGEVALFVAQFSGAYEHGATMINVSVESTETLLQAPSNTGHFPIFIGQINTEIPGEGVEFDDPSNSLHGAVYYSNNGGEPPTFTGCRNLRIINQFQARGLLPAETTPDVPATGVELTNPFSVDAYVTITGGTVTDIQTTRAEFGATHHLESTGLTQGPVILPAGHRIALTYSSAPTWKWTAL